MVPTVAFESATKFSDGSLCRLCSLTNKDKQILEMTGFLEQFEATSRELEAENDELKRSFLEMEQLIKERDARIASLESQTVAKDQEASSYLDTQLTLLI